MEHVLRFMADVKFKYDRKVANVVKTTMSKAHAEETRRREWLLTAQSVVQTRRTGVAEKSVADAGDGISLPTASVRTAARSAPTSSC
jgi:hypothetical protein